MKLSERTYRIPARAVIGLLEPELLSRSSKSIEPDADVEGEIADEPAMLDEPAVAPASA